MFQIRDRSRVKNPGATATWPDTDENDNQRRYSYELKYYTLCDPPEKLYDPLPKKINWNTEEYPLDNFSILEKIYVHDQLLGTWI